jgi:hypothetical protein
MNIVSNTGKTNKGNIQIKLLSDAAPNHVANFVYLAELGFFDGLTFHRVIPNFMAQGGCPLGNGPGGSLYQPGSGGSGGVPEHCAGVLGQAEPIEEAVVVFKRRRAPFIETGFAQSQVLSFGSLRGTNALSSVRRLHVVGRPMPPGDDLVFLAQVIHHDASPISGQITLVSRSYGGQRAAIDVVDFADTRVAELNQTAAVLLPGDRELNEVKLRKILGPDAGLEDGTEGTQK